MQLATRAVVTAVLAAAVAVAGYLGGLPLSITAAVLALVFALGWPALAGLPFVPGSAAVVALGGVGAVAVVHLTTTQPYLRDLPVVFAAAILLAFVNELLRRDGRTRLVESVSGTVAGTLVAVAVSGWVAIGRTPGGEPIVVVGALALAVGSAVVALHLAPWVGALVTGGRGGRCRHPGRAAAPRDRPARRCPARPRGRRPRRHPARALRPAALARAPLAVARRGDPAGDGDRHPRVRRRPGPGGLTVPPHRCSSSPCWPWPPCSGSGGARATAGTPRSTRRCWRRRPADAADDSRLTAAELGAPLGARATFVQFSSEVCAPCRRTHAVLAQLVSEHEGLSHVEMDVVEHLDLVRRFGIMRTPTTLLLDAHGVVVGRMSGATDRRHALAALEASCPGGVPAA